MSQGGGQQQLLQDPVPLPSFFDTSTPLTSLQDVQDGQGVYVCVQCCLDHNPAEDEPHRVLFFNDKPSAITHKQSAGHDTGWYRETIYKPARDGFVHPRIVDAARQLDATINTVELIAGTRDKRKDRT